MSIIWRNQWQSKLKLRGGCFIINDCSNTFHIEKKALLVPYSTYVHVFLLTGKPLRPTTWSESFRFFSKSNISSRAFSRSLRAFPAFEEYLIMSLRRVNINKWMWKEKQRAQKNIYHKGINIQVFKILGFYKIYFKLYNSKIFYAHGWR